MVTCTHGLRSVGKAIVWRVLEVKALVLHFNGATKRNFHENDANFRLFIHFLWCFITFIVVLNVFPYLDNVKSDRTFFSLNAESSWVFARRHQL